MHSPPPFNWLVPDLFLIAAQYSIEELCHFLKPTCLLIHLSTSAVREDVLFLRPDFYFGITTCPLHSFPVEIPVCPSRGYAGLSEGHFCD